MEIPVRKLFWDALEIALEAQTHRLAKDIAAVLGEPDAPLLKALKEEKIRVRLVEDAIEVDDLAEHRCKHYHQVGFVWRICGEPVLWLSGSEPASVCPYHALNPCAAAPGPPLVELEIEDEGTFFVNRETKAVYTSAGVLCGRLSEEGDRVELFDVC